MKVEYKDKKERKNIINKKKAEGNFLVEDAILKDGKYLVFNDKPLSKQSVDSPSIEDRMTKLEKTVANIQKKIKNIEIQ